MVDAPHREPHRDVTFDEDREVRSKEIGSGLNGNRRLRRFIGDPSVGTIIVEHRERLCPGSSTSRPPSARAARILVVDDGEVEDDLVRDATDDVPVRPSVRQGCPEKGERAVAAAGEPCRPRTRGVVDAALSAYAALSGLDLFAEVSSGIRCVDEEGHVRGLQRGAGIPGGEGLGGSQLLHVETLKGLVRRAGRELAGARKKGIAPGPPEDAQALRSRLARVEADMAAGLVRLCFGGRKLWRGQYNLEANGYGSMRSGWPVGERRGTASSSCWGAGMRPVAASCAWPGLLTMAP